MYIYHLTSYIDPHTTSFVNDTQYLVPCPSARTVTIGRTMDILPKLSSRPILNAEVLELALLYIDTLKNISLVKSAALFFYNTYYLTQYSRLG